MAKKKTENESLENIEQTLTRTEQFIEDNYRPILIVLGVILLIVVGSWLMRNRLKTMDKEAQAEMFVAESYFEQDSFRLALNGDGINLGFLDVEDLYGNTKTGNLAAYYAGISYLKLGQYESAIDYLEEFKSRDAMLSVEVEGALGDAWVELGETGKAVEQYKKAASQVENSFLNPLYLQRLAMTYELREEYDKALDTYRHIRDEYPESNEGRAAEKHIARLEFSK